MVEDKKYEINVIVRTAYLPEQIIVDGGNDIQEVRGLGVVGEQPLLKPGDSFEYTSGTAISSPVGSMKGSYQMVAEDGLRFDAPIPEFTLSVPRVLH
jgi:ApaG protein